jgi:hypothetical protein
MGNTRIAPGPDKWVKPCCAVMLCIFMALLPRPTLAADMTFSSKTYLLYNKKDVPGSSTKTFAPLYEYFSADARQLGGSSFSLHVYGWGRTDLQDQTGDNKTAGELGNAYLQYLHPTGNGEMRIGRFFLAEGAAAEIMDGIYLKGRTALGFGVSVFGGVPAEDSITATKTGDSIYGGRLFYAYPGVTEIGVSYLQEKGAFQGKDRTEIGGDLWLRPAKFMEFIGRATYNDATQAIASQRHLLRLIPVDTVGLSVGYESYSYKDLFQTALNSAFQFPALDETDKVQTAFAILEWEFVKSVTLVLGAKNIKHEAMAIGNANRGELGLKYSYNNLRDAAGITAAVVNADRDENAYKEYRGYVTYSPAQWRFALDALTQQYQQPINAVSQSYQVVGSVGYKLSEIMQLSGDLRYTKSPRYDEDYSGIIRASLLFGTTTGGKK